jgi:hypothetical protein
MIRPRARWRLSLLAFPVLAIAGCGAMPGPSATNQAAVSPAAAQASPEVPLVAGALGRRLDAMLASPADSGTGTLAR